MRWGFGWELGPFELIDAIGIGGLEPRARRAARRRPRSEPLPPRPARRRCELPADLRAKERSRVVKKNAGASLVDLGDGVLCVEFHSKMNAIGGDTIQMLQAGVREASRTSRRSSSATRRRTSPPAPT